MSRAGFGACIWGRTILSSLTDVVARRKWARSCRETQNPRGSTDLLAPSGRGRIMLAAIIARWPGDTPYRVGVVICRGTEEVVDRVATDALRVPVGAER